MEEAHKRRRCHSDNVDSDLSNDDDNAIWAVVDEQFKNNTNFEVYCREELIPRMLSDESRHCFHQLHIVFQYLKNIYAERNFSLLQLAIAFLPCTQKACLFISTLNDEVNVQGPGGETALFLAIRLDKLAFVKQLAEDGADFAVKNDKGEYPIIIARQQGNYDMISFVHLKSTEVESLSQVLFPTTLRLR